MKGYLLWVPKMRITLFWGLYWGPLILGNYPFHVALAFDLVVHSLSPEAEALSPKLYRGGCKNCGPFLGP